MTYRSRLLIDSQCRDDCVTMRTPPLTSHGDDSFHSLGKGGAGVLTTIIIIITIIITVRDYPGRQRFNCVLLHHTVPVDLPDP